MKDVFPVVATIPYAPKIREQFRDNELWQEWYERYPELFDERDLRNVSNQARSNSHFHEWLGAILMYQMTGWYSLQQKYQFRHKRKRKILEELGAYPLIDFFGKQKSRGWGNLQAPDLLVYSPDKTDWYMLEIKGPMDSLRPEQIQYFMALSEASRKSIRVLYLTTM